MTKRCLGSMYQGIIMFIVFYKPGNCLWGKFHLIWDRKHEFPSVVLEWGGTELKQDPWAHSRPGRPDGDYCWLVRVFLREGRLQEFPTPAMPIETFLPFMSPLVPPSSNPDPLTVHYGVQENRRASTCPHRLGCFQSNPLALEA